MKFRNLLVASLVCFAFTSCSKDEGSEPEKPMEPVDAYLTIRTTANILTKAVTGGDDDPKTNNGTINEKFINTLNVYLFNAADKLVYYKRIDATRDNEGKSIKQIDSILVKVTPTRDFSSSEETFKMVLLANVKDFSVTTLPDLSTEPNLITGNILDYKVAGTGNDNGDLGSYLPMKSGEISIKNLIPTRTEDKEKPIINWVGSEGSIFQNPTDGQDADKYISLTRMVARIQIDKISLNLQGRYPGASFKLDTISLVNVRSNINMNGGLGDFFKGYQSYNFVVDQKLIFSGNVKEYLAVSLDNSTFLKEGTPVDQEWIDPINSDGTKKTFCRYVFPNTDSQYATAILLSGYFRVNDNQESQLRQYLIPLVKDEVKSVIPNTIYRVSVEINGEGSKNEDDPELTASISVKLEVEPWKIVYQTEEDKN